MNRWPVAPLFAYVAASMHKTPHRTDGCVCNSAVTYGAKPAASQMMPRNERECLSRTEFSKQLRTSIQRLEKWEREGLSTWDADEMAVRAGTNPQRLWGRQWDDVALSVLDELHLYGSEHALPGWRQAYEWAVAS